MSKKELIKLRNQQIKERRLLVALFLGIAFLLIIDFMDNKNAFKNVKQETKIVIVDEGDTLWSIASKANSESYKKQDIRDIVYQIKEKNDLAMQYIYPGQILEVPVNIYANKD